MPNVITAKCVCIHIYQMLPATLSTKKKVVFVSAALGNSKMLEFFPTYVTLIVVFRIILTISF